MDLTICYPGGKANVTISYPQRFPVRDEVHDRHEPAKWSPL